MLIFNVKIFHQKEKTRKMDTYLYYRWLGFDGNAAYESMAFPCLCRLRRACHPDGVFVHTLAVIAGLTRNLLCGKGHFRSGSMLCGAVCFLALSS